MTNEIFLTIKEMEKYKSESMLINNLRLRILLTIVRKIGILSDYCH